MVLGLDLGIWVVYLSFECQLQRSKHHFRIFFFYLKRSHFGHSCFFSLRFFILIIIIFGSCLNVDFFQCHRIHLGLLRGSSFFLGSYFIYPFWQDLRCSNNGLMTLLREGIRQDGQSFFTSCLTEKSFHFHQLWTINHNLLIVENIT